MSSTLPSDPIPITILTGFLGSGKTTLLLSLLPQLPPGYKLCLLKNELGDVRVDSQLASQNSVAGVTELINGCICCNLVGQLSEALIDLKETYKPTRIVIETSGSAFPATLAMEVNRISESHPNAFTLDGVIQVLDVENWTGYADTSFTAKLQSKYTDLIVLNKHELAGPEREELVLDRIRDVAEETPIVKTTHGKIDASVIFGIDSSLAKNFAPEKENAHAHVHDHHSEVDVISLRLPSALTTDGGFIDATALRTLLTTAPKDEVYRIKGILRIAEGEVPLDPNAIDPPFSHNALHESWILNWAFGRWTFTPLRESSVSTTIEAPNLALPQAPFMNGVRKGSIEVLVQTSISTTVEETAPAVGDAARLNFVVARGEGERWTRKLQQATGGLKLRSGEREGLVVAKLGP